MVDDAPNLAEDLKKADPQFLDFFKRVCLRQFHKAVALSQHPDYSFQTVIENAVANPDSLYLVAVEKRDALQLVFNQCKETWTRLGHTVER